MNDDHEDLSEEEVREMLKTLMGAVEAEIKAETQRSKSAVEQKPRSWMDAVGSKKR